jgi:probable phosphoglycerate mutase
MTRRLILVRHGRTAWNAENRAQGHADVPLDEVGHTQAREVAPVLAGLRPVALWSSDLARALQTAEYVAGATGLPIHTDPRLREYDVGARQGLTAPEFAASFPDEYDAHGGAFSTRGVPGAETPEQLAARYVPALIEMVDGLQAGETALAVSHGAAIRVGIAGVLGWSLDQAATLGVLGNCAWVALERRGDEGPIRLARYGLAAG